MYHLAIGSTSLMGIPGSYSYRIFETILNTKHNAGFVSHVEINSLPDVVWPSSMVILDYFVELGIEIEFPLFYLAHTNPLKVQLKCQVLPKRIHSP